MQIERISETDLTRADEEAISALLNRAFDNDFGRFSYFQQRHHLRIVARLEGGIVGHMALGFRAIRLGDTIHDAATLAEVATDPDFQGQGIASALMPEMISAARAMGADFAMLFGNRPIYAGHGFGSVANHTTWLDLSGRSSIALRQGRAKDLMVLQLGDAGWDETAPLDLLGHKF